MADFTFNSTTYNSPFTEYYAGVFTGNFTGNFSGSFNGSLVNGTASTTLNPFSGVFSGNMSGNFNGWFIGTFNSNSFNGTYEGLTYNIDSYNQSSYNTGSSVNVVIQYPITQNYFQTIIEEEPTTYNDYPDHPMDFVDTVNNIYRYNETIVINGYQSSDSVFVINDLIISHNATVEGDLT